MHLSGPKKRRRQRKKRIINSSYVKRVKILKYACLLNTVNIIKYVFHLVKKLKILVICQSYTHSHIYIIKEK